ncbi:unnamed protein product [Prorocentrum cordatum]|uniref:Uncharacterized protein n=1 Tax=Prorocentrum cordatum TaxID=2364126 RepID=A0ABN9SGN6_9DINO|nr:unnamed protein product [Polarella glacialis]
MPGGTPLIRTTAEEKEEEEEGRVEEEGEEGRRSAQCCRVSAARRGGRSSQKAPMLMSSPPAFSETPSAASEKAQKASRRGRRLRRLWSAKGAGLQPTPCGGGRGPRRRSPPRPEAARRGQRGVPQPTETIVENPPAQPPLQSPEKAWSPPGLLRRPAPSAVSTLGAPPTQSRGCALARASAHLYASLKAHAFGTPCFLKQRAAARPLALIQSRSREGERAWWQMTRRGRRKPLRRSCSPPR